MKRRPCDGAQATKIVCEQERANDNEDTPVVDVRLMVTDETYVKLGYETGLAFSHELGVVIEQHHFAMSRVTICTKNPIAVEF